MFVQLSCGAAGLVFRRPRRNEDTVDSADKQSIAPVEKQPGRTLITHAHRQLLADRSIPFDFAIEHGIRSIDLAALRRFVDRTKVRPKWPHLPLHPVTGILIEYQECLDGIPRVRVRSDVTSYVRPGPEPGSHVGEETMAVPRYICQAQVKIAPYIPPEVFRVAGDVTVPLYLTEAPLKALSLTANGWPAIGMGGIYAGVADPKIKAELDELAAHPELRRIQWSGRTAYICYDAGLGGADDGLGNPQVAQAAARIWRVLSDLGAIVRIVHTPYTHPQQTNPEAGQLWSPTDQGPDDYIARNGVESFQQLIDASVVADPVQRLLAASEGLKGVERAVAVAAVLREPIMVACLSEASSATLAAVVATKLIQARALKSTISEFKDRLAARVESNDPFWMGELHRTPAGVVRASIENVELAFRHDKGLAGLVAFDEMRQEITLAKEPPWKDQYAGSAGSKIGDAWTDVDDLRLAGYLASVASILDINPQKVKSVVTLMANERRVNPVVEYLTGLTWDGESRLESWLATYLSVEASAYSSAVGRWWMISAVARAMQPGCQADHVLVLEGQQGRGKSTALRILGGEYFSEADLADLKGKDSVLALQGSWIHEFREGDVFSRAGFRALKGFITLVKDDVVLKYSNRRSSLPRRCVFAISLNPDHGGYLADDENRRYWPVLCDGEIDTAGLRQVRHQLWAEAVAAYRAGLSWWPATPEEKALCAEQQQGREIVDAWTDRVRESVRCIATVTVAAALDTVGVELGRRTQADTRRAAKILRGLGWVEAPSRKGGARVWLRGADATPIEDASNVVPLFSVDDHGAPADNDVLRALLDSV